MAAFPRQFTRLKIVNCIGPFQKSYTSDCMNCATHGILFPQGSNRKRELNRDHVMLKSVTEELITSHDDLVTFGLHLGFTCDKIEQMRTNHPCSVEGAALHLAYLWWNQEKASSVNKAKVLLQSVDPLKKPWLTNRLSTMMQTSLK